MGAAVDGRWRRASSGETMLVSRTSEAALVTVEAQASQAVAIEADESR